ncbi:MAG: hypothetical protein EOL97_13750 [Spirochaetia bacterium]|nr:hypothetical protein [Spirochaetia bacterium]
MTKDNIMNKTTPYCFDTVLYPFKIYVIVNKTPDIIAKYFKEYSGEDVIFTKDDGTNRMDAFTMSVISKDDNDYGALLFFRSKQSMTPGLIAHEASHATKMLFEHIGADMREHEPFEYVLEFIVNNCYKIKTNTI